MDFLTGKIKPMYFKYLIAAFGSADFVHLWRGGYGCCLLYTSDAADERLPV